MVLLVAGSLLHGQRRPTPKRLNLRSPDSPDSPDVLASYIMWVARDPFVPEHEQNRLITREENLPGFGASGFDPPPYTAISHVFCVRDAHAPGNKLEDPYDRE